MVPWGREMIGRREGGGVDRGMEKENESGEPSVIKRARRRD